MEFVRVGKKRVGGAGREIDRRECLSYFREKHILQNAA